MRHFPGMVCALTIGLVCSAGRAEPFVRAVKVQAPPAVDGRLDDPCWTGVPAYESFQNLDDGSPARQSTRLRCVYDREKMYFAVECRESPAALAKAGKPGTEVKRDDSLVELYFQPQPVTDHLKYVQVPGMWYYVLAFNAAGAHYGQCGRFVPIPGAFDVKTVVGKDGWQAEVAVPFASLKAGSPANLARWRFQVRRNAFVDGRREGSTLFAARQVANNIETFGTMVFMERPTQNVVVNDAGGREREGAAAKLRSIAKESLIRTLGARQLPVALVPHPTITDSQKVRPEFVPAEKDLGRVLRVRLATNEFASASLVLWSPRPCPEVRVEVGSLSGASGPLAPGVVDLRWVKCWYQAGTHVIEICGYELTPELLLKNPELVRVDRVKQKNMLGYSKPPPRKDRPDDSNDIQPLKELPAEFAQQVWLTVKVPATTPAGIYRGTVTARSREKVLGRLPLEIEVLDFELRESPLDSNLYVCSGWGPSATENSPVCARAEMKNLVDHGIRYVGLWEHAQDMEAVVRMMRQAGLRTDRIFICNVGRPIPVTSANDPPAAVYERAMVWAKVLKKTGVVRETYQYLVDEAGGSVLTAERPLAAALHRAGARTWVACNRDYFPLAGDFIDLAVVAGPPDPVLARTVHEAGKRIYSYANPQCGLELPETYRRNFGLRLWQAGYDGAFDFSYNCGFDDPWNDVDHEVWKDHLMVYPTRSGVIDTIQWEGWRAGVDDCRYLATLEYWADQARQTGRRDPAQTARAWLTKARDTGTEALTNMDEVRDAMVRLIKQCRSTSARPAGSMGG